MQHVGGVIPAQAGIEQAMKLGPDFRRGDNSPFGLDNLPPEADFAAIDQRHQLE